MRQDEFAAVAVENERRYRANLARTVEALREADAASVSVDLTDPHSPTARVCYAPSETDGENTPVRFDVARYVHRRGKTVPKRIAMEVSLNQAVRALAVQHVERSGLVWRGRLIGGLIVQIDAEDGSVATKVQRPH